MEGHGTDPWGGSCSSQVRDVCVVITNSYDISGILGGGVPVKGTQPGQAQKILHVQSLEVQVIYTTGGTNITTVLP